MAVEINVDETPSEEEEIEVPEWQPLLLEVKNLFGEILSEIRQSNQNHQQSSTLATSLLETNSQLTRTIQEGNTAMMDRIALLTPPPSLIVVTPPSDEPPQVDDVLNPLEVPPEEKEKPAPPRKRRAI